ncbi:MAG: HlyD family efflux transporter periplasmic adaptor subunit [Planctomycetota bacterium]|nr:HlyD family efflux transporter periplasmic adaptor subunit [Planctomycetota bacterium]
MNPPKLPPKLIGWIIAVVIAAGVFWQSRLWLPSAKQWLANQLAEELLASQKDKPSDAAADPHAGHDHAGHDDGSSLELSKQARHNIGLTNDMIREIELQDFVRTISVPAIVVERTGRTRLKVVAPMTGVVTAVNLIKGESIEPGRLLFRIRLTHEELVQAQTVFLKTLGELDVEVREIKRLKGITNQGVIAGKVLLEREYSMQKLEAELSAYREALLLHGLSESQVNTIAERRKLLGELDVMAPGMHTETGEVRLRKNEVEPNALRQAAAVAEIPLERREFVVQDLNVTKGEYVQAGQTLTVLADFAELYIEGRAFEHDTDQLATATREGWSVQAVSETGTHHKSMDGLKILFLNNEIEAESRALHFYVGLKNEIVNESATAAKHRFVTWRYRPGQRMQLRIPVERWQNRIVLPIDAVAQEGAEFFVFQQNGDHFDRKPVHVEHRDQKWAVIANDGSLFPRDAVAMTGAHLMQVALKNKAGGAPDPHAGHNH